MFHAGGCGDGEGVGQSVLRVRRIAAGMQTTAAPNRKKAAKQTYYRGRDTRQSL